MGTRIDELNPGTASEDHKLPAMLGGVTIFLSVRQILSFVQGKIGGYIHAATAKSALVSADEIGLWDNVTGLLNRITLANFWSQSKWRSVKIGEIYMVNTSLTGVDVPPVNDPEAVFIELTAGLTGSGGFNNGKLTSESVSGSAPLVIATAVIAVTGSPMNGQTVDLLNTEGRILRPGVTSGTKQADALQNITGSVRLANTGGGVAYVSQASAAGALAPGSVTAAGDTGANGGGTFARDITLDASLVARTSAETRMKNVSVKAYMRVK